jgi:hypothetical protein
MSTISGKLNFLQLKVVVKKMKAQSGEINCLVIPIEENNLFVGEKGIYLDFIGFEYKSKKEDQKDTHLIKQSLPKEIREKLTPAELESIPIIGNLQVWGEKIDSEPVSNPDPLDEVDDLPF